MSLISYPNVPAIVYKGFGGFFDKQECEEKRILIENDIARIEIERGNTVYIETYCMEFESFESSVKKDKKLKATNTLDENLDDKYRIEI